MTIRPNSRDSAALSVGPLCPVDNPSADCILLAHGEGGRLMRQLLQQRIAPILNTSAGEDAARLQAMDGDLAVTTDSFVVSPLFFPGGDIGSLAVYGTVNDLAVSGAKPIAITLSLIIEEGLSLASFDQILRSIATAAEECQVRVIAGDTKVVPHGAADKLFINTTGVGCYPPQTALGCAQIRVGDSLLVSGPLGRHGISVLAARAELNLHPEPKSDSANLQRACAALHAELGADLRTMRDATRGGLSAVLHEWSEASGRSMKLIERRIPVTAETRGVCELLGLDPLYVANEGTFVAAVAPTAQQRALEVLRAFQVSAQAQAVGEVIDRISSPVVIERMLGSLHSVDEPSGAPLPRIC